MSIFRDGGEMPRKAFGDLCIFKTKNGVRDNEQKDNGKANILCVDIMADDWEVYNERDMA